MDDGTKRCKRGHDLSLPENHYRTGRCRVCQLNRNRNKTKRLRTQCREGHALTADNTRIIQQDSGLQRTYTRQICLTCERARAEKKKARGRTQAENSSDEASLVDQAMQLIDKLERNPLPAEREELTAQLMKLRSGIDRCERNRLRRAQGGRLECTWTS